MILYTYNHIYNIYIYMCVLLQYILCIHPFRSPVAPATAVHWPNLRRRGRPRCRCAAEASRCPAMGGSYPWRPEIHGENHGETMGEMLMLMYMGKFSHESNVLDGGGALYFLSWTLASPAKFGKAQKCSIKCTSMACVQSIFFVLDFNIAQFLIDSGKCFSEYDQFGDVWGSM